MNSALKTIAIAVAAAASLASAAASAAPPVNLGGTGNVSDDVPGETLYMEER
jgi:hypothetical protein